MEKVTPYSLMGEGEPGKYLLTYGVAACESLLMDLIFALRKGQRRLKVAS